MKERLERRGGAFVLVQYLQEPPDPTPTRLHGNHLTELGFTCKGSRYSKEGFPDLFYDGNEWWLQDDPATTGYPLIRNLRIDTLEQLQEIFKDGPKPTYLPKL